MDAWPKKVPVPEQTKGKTAGGGLGAGIFGALFAIVADYFGADGTVLLAISTTGSIIGGAVGSYAVRNYITDPRVIELLANLSEELQRKRTTLRSSWIASVGAISLAGMMLSGCGVTIDGTIDDTERGMLDSAKLLAITAIVSLNEAGVDPLQVPEDKLTLVRMGCDIVAGGVTIVNPDNPDIGAEIRDFCEIFITGVGSAG